jgi:calcineurin-like phosphoesterase
VAKLEPKFRPDLIIEPKHTFSKINEDIYALCWFLDSKNELLYGTETHVKVCDTREY